MMKNLLRLVPVLPLPLFPIFVLASFLWGCRPETAPRRVEVLFPGHDGKHHHSEAFLPLLAADRIAPHPDGAAKAPVPDIPGVMTAGNLVDPGKTYSLRFKVPEKPGNYPFVCTFPGHRRTMKGVMKALENNI